MSSTSIPALHTAVCRQDVRAVKRLIASGAEVDLRDGDGRTALILAVDVPEIVALLLMAGANARAASGGVCALHRATAKGRYESVRLLLQRVGLLCCDHAMFHDPPIRTATINLACLEPFEGAVYGRITSLLLAGGARLSDAHEREITHYGFYRATLFADADPAQNAEAAVTGWHVARKSGAIKAAAFDLQRERMTDVCIALQSYHLPALVTVFILREACAPPGSSLRFSHCWEVATKVKHLLS